MAVDASKNAFRRTANAKINLCLHVTGQRADGYHLIDSLVGFAAFGDTISLHEADHDSLTLTGAYSGALDEESTQQNSVLKARDWLRDRHTEAGQNVSAVAISLDKQLPVASGIGGGSADAAATLTALARLWRSPAQWLEDYPTISAELGADVPMCLQQKPVRVTGIGEEISPWHRVPMLPCVMVNPGKPVLTPEVFQRLETRRNEPIGDVPPLLDSVGDLAEWLGESTRNDLQRPAEAVCPEIAVCISALQKSGALLARMSGSGASCFGLYESTDKAQDAARNIAQASNGWFVQATAILPSPPLQDEDYPQWVESMTAVRSLH